MTRNAGFIFVLSCAILLPACARQSTPSMMNTSLPRVVPQTTMQQVPVDKVSEGYLAKVADDYARFGSSVVHLSLAYDPDSKTYTATQAFEDLSKFKEKLAEMDVRSVTAETVKTAGSNPVLMVSYDSVAALAPEGCRNMPGMENALTTGEIADYRFGCSTESTLARQIYRPSDLQGNAVTEPGDGRKAANIVEFDRRIEKDEVEGELERLQRSDINSQ